MVLAAASQSASHQIFDPAHPLQSGTAQPRISCAPPPSFLASPACLMAGAVSLLTCLCVPCAISPASRPFQVAHARKESPLHLRNASTPWLLALFGHATVRRPGEHSTGTLLMHGCVLLLQLEEKKWA